MRRATTKPSDDRAIAPVQVVQEKGRSNFLICCPNTITKSLRYLLFTIVVSLLLVRGIVTSGSVDWEVKQEPSTNEVSSAPPPLNTNSTWQNGLYDGPLCPSLLQIARYITSKRSPPDAPMINITMMQLVGSWKDESTGAVMENVYTHNQRVCARHGYQTMAVTQLPPDQHAAFAKILAIRDGCLSPQAPELLWFLDGDVVLMNPYIRIEMLWYYYKDQYPEMDMLFACDNNHLNSGVFIVNCSSPMAIQLLDIWHYYAPVVNSWHNVHTGLYEQNGISWLLQTPFWKQFHPRHKRSDQLLENSTDAEKRQFATSELEKRVRVIDQICELTVFPIDFICDGAANDRYLTRGPTWWEEGHFAVHTAGTRNKFRRLPFLVYMMLRAEHMKIPPPARSVVHAAQEYLDKYEHVQSRDPTKNHSFEKCFREERRTNRLARLEQRAKEEALMPVNASATPAQ